MGDPEKEVSSIGHQTSSLGTEGAPSMAMDHDTDKKVKAVPSILLRVVISYEENGSFYDGHVSFSLRNLVFDGTNVIMNMVLLMDVMQWDESKIRSMLVYMRDGGADHNMTHLSVQCGMISVCLLLKLDYSIFVRTIPGHSWSNVVERVMLILNLVLQGVYLACADTDTGNERIMKRCSRLVKIRAAARNTVYFK